MADPVPEPISLVLDRMRQAWAPVPCSACQQDFLRPDGSDAQVCPACAVAVSKRAVIEAEAERVIANLDRWIPVWLSKAGLSKRELTATWSGVPAKLARLLSHPPLEVRAMLAGGVPAHGFGLAGDAGTGKTFALAAIVKAMTVARWRAWAPLDGIRATRPWLAWEHWPERVNEMRVRSMSDGGFERVAGMMDSLSTIEVLVLDDLGAERLRGEYADDWAASQLDGVIDRRYNDLRPTWFTTNLGGEEFLGRYGARMYSRLCGANAMLQVPSGPDLRIVKPVGGA
jgi:hypothetical protein